MKLFEKFDNAFIALMKGTYYFMKVAFGLVLGSGIGLIFLVNVNKPLGTILFFILTFLGLIGGIFYAIKTWQQRRKRSHNNELF